MINPEVEQTLELDTRIFQDFQTAAGLAVRRSQLIGMQSEAERTATGLVQVREVDPPNYFEATAGVDGEDDWSARFRDSAEHFILYAVEEERIKQELRTIQKGLSKLVVGKAVTIGSVSEDPVIEQTYLSSGMTGTGRQEHDTYRDKVKGIIHSVKPDTNQLFLLPRRNSGTSINRGHYVTQVLDTETGQPVITIDFRETGILDTQPTRRISKFLSRLMGLNS